MGDHMSVRIISSLLLVLVLLACLPVCAFAEPSELSNGDEAGISLSTTVPPSVISGSDAVYGKGGASGLIFTTDDARSNFLQVMVDGKIVSSENYTVSGEPLGITLDTDYLDGLTEGTHTIGIETENGTAKASFTVRASSAPVIYTIISGANGEWTKGSKEGLLFTSDADFDKFDSVLVDGNAVAAENYTAVKGSTKITLLPSYLEKLRVGSHTIRIVSNDGSASTNFRIKAAPQPTDPTSPKTGDNSHLLLWVLLLAVSGAALTGTVIYSRKKKKTN